MMKQRRSRLTLWLLALALMLAPAAPAMAAETPAETAAPVITDIEPGAWYTGSVLWAADNGYALGTGGGQFGIGQPCAKADALTLLWRVAGGGTAAAGAEALDAALAWLAERSGVALPAAAFAGTEKRVDFVRILYLALGEGAEAPDAGFADLTGDVLAERPNAVQAVNWAVSKGITNGTGPAAFSPEEELTREQVVTMLYRWRMAEDGYVTRYVPVFRETLTDERAELRFYAEAPNVAYIGIGAYYAMMLPGAKMQVEQSGHVYTLTSQTGAATADTEKDSLTSPDLNAFTNLMDQVQKGMPNVYSDGVRYVTVLGADYDRPAETVTLDLAKYHIDLRDGDGDVWFPLATVSDIFTDLFYHYASFNGCNVYVNDDNHIPSDCQRDPYFYDLILSDAPRPADMAAFSYNELCFNVDNFYGFPGRAPAEAAIREKGFDAALTESWPEIKAKLLSTDVYEYLVGQFEIANGPLNDGGHTGFSAVMSILGRLAEDEEASAAFTAKAVEKGFDEALNSFLEVNAGKLALYSELPELRSAAWGDEQYVKQGDTAVFVFDSFIVIDFQGWEAYVSGTGPRPTAETDDYVRFVEALERAEADPEVKNFVIDLTVNSGGSLDELMAMTDQMIGVADTLMYDPLTKQFITEHYAVDRNLDGRIDAADALVKHDRLNYAVLTSGICFSCANLFPSILRDNGVMILGEKTDGGSCAVQKNAFGDGFGYQISSHHGRLYNAAGENIDTGVPVDVDLVRVNEDGTADYSAFYDISVLSAAINAFYAEELDNAA